MKRMHPLTKRLYIEELERPALADTGGVTTLAIGEECDKGDKVTTQATGEETIAG
jgi:hypothetical protein